MSKHNVTFTFGIKVKPTQEERQKHLQKCTDLWKKYIGMIEELDIVATPKTLMVSVNLTTVKVLEDIADTFTRNCIAQEVYIHPCVNISFNHTVLEKETA